MSSTLFVLLNVCCLTVLSKRYEPTWESIDSRPLPQWFDDGKIGIQIHWGVFSVPSFGTIKPGPEATAEWFWWIWKSNFTAQREFMKTNYRPGFTYPEFANEFTAENFNADEWAELFEAAGAKYTAFNAKHHEGFTNWPSKYSFNWNSMDVGPKRDLVGEFAAALRRRNKVRFGVYHSMFEWYHPLWTYDSDNGYRTNRFVAEKVQPELRELVNAYKPDLIWSDGDWMAQDTYWNSTHFLAWLYNDSPVKDTVIVNDRWGIQSKIWCQHGGYMNCQDEYDPGVLQRKKWESVMSFDYWSFGLRRLALASQYRSMEDITTLIARVISCGGNLLMNVGPTKDGRIIPIQELRLRQMGSWLKVNGEAIYSSQPWKYQRDTTNPSVWYTSKRTATGLAVYAIVLNWPHENILHLGAPVVNARTQVSMLGYHGNKTFKLNATSPTGVTVLIPPLSYDEYPCQWAWVFKFIGLVW